MSVDSDIMLMALRFCALVFFGGAATLDLFFLFKFSDSDRRFDFPALKYIKMRGFTVPVIALALVTTLIFTVPNQIFGSGATHIAKPDGILFGSLIYALAVALVVLFAVMHSKTTIKQLFSYKNATYKRSISRGVIYGIAAIPPVVIITVIMSMVIGDLGLVAESQPVIDWLTNPETTFTTRIVIIFCAVVIAPVIEEVIFRGILFPAVLKNNSFILAVLLVGCIFSLIHFHAPSFLSILMLNIFFCAGYASTGSLVTPIVMHMVFNGTATFFALII